MRQCECSPFANCLFGVSTINFHWLLLWWFIGFTSGFYELLAHPQFFSFFLFYHHLFSLSLSHHVPWHEDMLCYTTMRKLLLHSVLSQEISPFLWTLAERKRGRVCSCLFNPSHLLRSHLSLPFTETALAKIKNHLHVAKSNGFLPSPSTSSSILPLDYWTFPSVAARAKMFFLTPLLPDSDCWSIFWSHPGHVPLLFLYSWLQFSAN